MAVMFVQFDIKNNVLLTVIQGIIYLLLINLLLFINYLYIYWIKTLIPAYLYMYANYFYIPVLIIS